jgi:type IV secretion system protein VirB10
MPMPEEEHTTDVEPSGQSPVAVPSLRDRRILPEGVVPKQAQGYVVAGLAMMVLLATLFSKNHSRTAPAALPNTQPYSNDVNARKIEELKEDLSAEQRQAQAAKSGAVNPANGATPPQASGTAPASQLPSAPSQSTEPKPNPIADAERELAFRARFASNLIGTDSRAANSPVQYSSDTAAAPFNDAPSTARSSSLPSQAAATQTASATKQVPEVNINAASGQSYVLFEGTTIDTVLTNRLDGEFAGPVKVMVSNAIYSHDRQHILIPEGTFLLGDVQKVAGFGQKRLAVTFHRMLMPDGYSVDLDQFHGLDQGGDIGLGDKVNNHYMQIFGASIALGIIAGAAESTTSSGYNESGSDAYRQGVASSLSQSSANVLDRFINALPTITIREGHRIKIYITQDLLLPAYENHSMPEVF